MPSSKSYKRDYKQELRTEKRNHPERVHERAERNSARSQLEREGLVHKGDNLDVDHKKPLSKGGSNQRSNLRPRTSSANRSYERNADGSMKIII